MYLIYHVGMFIGPSMLYDFIDSISINSDLFEDGNLLSNQSAQDSVNKLTGYTFFQYIIIFDSAHYALYVSVLINILE